MDGDSKTREHVQAAERYFGSFVNDYHDAFEGKGHGLHGLINRLFRQKTFARRTDIVRDLLSRHGVAGKRVLDLGCGSGEVSIVAGLLGARVTGVDVVPGMVAIARQQADAAGLGDKAEFRVADITAPLAEPADVTMLIGVIEYYRDLGAVLGPAASATRELLIVADTRGPWWGRILRRLLARAKHFYLYYRPPAEVAATMARFGFVERERIPGHSFTIMTYRPEASAAR